MPVYRGFEEAMKSFLDMELIEPEEEEIRKLPENYREYVLHINNELSVADKVLFVSKTILEDEIESITEGDNVITIKLREEE